MSKEVKKETKVDDETMSGIEAFLDDADNGFRHRAEALRELVRRGLLSEVAIDNYADSRDRRLPLSVSADAHQQVTRLMKSLPREHHTFEIAYRLVILRGLHSLQV